jgi:IstB-like ATP binding protein
MKKNSTLAVGRKQLLKQAKLTIGLDLGDRTSYYCILDEAGNVIWERSVPTTSSGLRQAIGKMPRCRIALETGTHSPWVSRQLARMGHEVIVPLSKTGAELLFEVFSLRYERGSTLVTSNLPFQEWTEILGSERLTGALLDRLTHHVHILEMNGESYRLKQSKHKRNPPPSR